MTIFDWTSTIKINIVMLYLVGLWSESDKYDLYTLHTFFTTIIVMGGHNFFQAMNIFFVYNNLEALTETIFVVVTDVLASMKMYFFIRNVELRKKLMRNLRNDTFQPRNSKQINMVQPALKTWKVMYITFSIMASYTVVIWTVFPFLNNSFKTGRLPFAAWYPYDSRKSPCYELTYVYQVLAMWYLTVTNINMDTMIAALMVLTGAQCDILCNNLQTGSDLHYRRNFNENMMKCIRHHQEVIRYLCPKNYFQSVKF